MPISRAAVLGNNPARDTGRRCACIVTPERILVTGASGFAGRHLIPVLRRQFPGALLYADRFDLTDHAAIDATIRALRPDACVHLGAIAVPAEARRDPDRAWRVNVMGTLALARSILADAPNCRLLYVSSSEVYGTSANDPRAIDETALLAPVTPYGATKAAADLAIGAMVSEGLHAIRIRPFNHCGPGQSEDFVVSAFARQIALIAAGRLPPVLRTGDLRPARDFLDVRDVCAAYAACLAADPDRCPPGTILNLASGTPRTIGDIAGELCALAQIAPTIEPATDRLRAGEIMIARGDASRARALLNWTPAIPWARTLADTLADWRHRLPAI